MQTVIRKEFLDDDLHVVLYQLWLSSETYTMNVCIMYTSIAIISRMKIKGHNRAERGYRAVDYSLDGIKTRKQRKKPIHLRLGKERK